jgi:hypothetical protein
VSADIQKENIGIKIEEVRRKERRGDPAQQLNVKNVNVLNLNIMSPTSRMLSQAF